MNFEDPKIFFVAENTICATFQDSVERVKIGKDAFDVVQLLSIQKDSDSDGVLRLRGVESIFIHSNDADKDFTYSTVFGDDGSTNYPPKKFPSTFNFKHEHFYKVITESGHSTSTIMDMIKDMRTKNPERPAAIQIMNADKFLSEDMLERGKQRGVFYGLLPPNVLHIPLVDFKQLPTFSDSKYSPAINAKSTYLSPACVTFLLVEAVVENRFDNANSFDAILEHRLTEIFKENVVEASGNCATHSFHCDIAPFFNKIVEIGSSDAMLVYGSLVDLVKDTVSANTVFEEHFNKTQIKQASVLKFVIAMNFKEGHDPGFKDMFVSKLLKTVKKVNVACDDVISLKTMVKDIS